MLDRGNPIKNTLAEFTKGCNLALFQILGIPLVEKNGCKYGETGIPAALLNGVYKCSTPEGQVDTTVKHIADHFKSKNFPHSWWAESSEEPASLKAALEKMGLNLLGQFPGMGIQVAMAKEPPAIQGLDIETVTNDEDLQHWSGTLCEAFAFQDPVASMYCDLFRKKGYKGPFLHLVGKKNGRVVTTGSILFLDQGAYIYNVGTQQEHRNQGHASHIVSALLKVAKSKNYRIAALTSSPMAIPVYTSLGFEQVCTYNIYG